jgi:hypothetical protein
MMAKKWAELSTGGKIGSGCLGLAILVAFGLGLSIATTDVADPAKSPPETSSDKREQMNASMHAIVAALSECNEPLNIALEAVTASPDPESEFPKIDAAKAACTDSASKLPMIITPPLPPALARRWDDVIARQCAPKTLDQAEALLRLQVFLKGEPYPDAVKAISGRIQSNITDLTICITDLQAIAAENGTPI